MLLLCGIITNGQTINWLTTLENSVKETSGLIRVNQKLITHNDSGGEPALYEIDTVNGQVTRTVIVANASNIDWEDITADQTYMYIGDFGNNQGSRTNLKIYRIEISDYTASSNDTILADTINFSYGNQSNFTPANMATNFDAEAFVSIGDSLYIFTKNWKNGWTNVYGVYNQPGNYTLQKKDSLDVKGFISGATYNSASQTIIISGYNLILSPFVVEISGFSNGAFTNATLQKTALSLSSAYSTQVEGICHIKNDECFISSEASLGKSAALFKLDLANGMSISGLDKEYIGYYPNPVNDILYLQNDDIKEVEIFSESGKLLLRTKEQKIDVSILSSGTYLLLSYDFKGNISTYKVLKQ